MTTDTERPTDPYEIERIRCLDLAAAQGRAQAEEAAQRRPRSPVGEALVLHHDAVEHCEALYLAAAGEVTDETEAAEAQRDLTARQALEALAQYERHLDGLEARIAVEREALARLEASTAKRRAWADARIVDLAGTVAHDRTKIAVGVRTIRLRRSVAIETSESMDLAAVPDAWVRHVPEKVIPASRSLDKKAAAADLLLGYREGEPPGPGWYGVEGFGRSWLEPRLFEGESMQWTIGGGPGDPVADFLHALGMSFTPQPGLDVLRWKPSPPGVTLVRRVHVRIE